MGKKVGFAGSVHNDKLRNEKGDFFRVAFLSQKIETAKANDGKAG